MFANRFTVVIDACALVPVLQRNILLTLAEAELFRPRWSETILSETERAVCKLLALRGRPDPEAAAARAMGALRCAFQDAVVTGFEPLLDGIKNMPDPDDCHVVAAAIETRASVIVTENLKDFPAAVLQPHDLEAMSADTFLANSLDLNPAKAMHAIAGMLHRLRRPELTLDELVSKLEANGLTQTADQILRNLR